MFWYMEEGSSPKIVDQSLGSDGASPFTNTSTTSEDSGCGETSSGLPQETRAVSKHPITRLMERTGYSIVQFNGQFSVPSQTQVQPRGHPPHCWFQPSGQLWHHDPCHLPQILPHISREEQYGYVHDAEWEQRVPPHTDGRTQPETGHANSLLFFGEAASARCWVW